MGGGGGSRAPTEQRVISTDLPEYVEPYFKRILRRGEAESLQPRFQFGAERLAYFSPDELTAQALQRGASQAGTPQELMEASRSVQNMPTGYSSGYTAPSDRPRFPFQPFPQRPGFGGPFRGPVSRGGGIRTADMRDANRDGIDDRDAFAFRGSPRGMPIMPPRSSIPSYSKLPFERGVSRFMSPYQQRVTDIAKRQAESQSAQQGEQIAEQAARAGGLGGYREAILQAERQKNLGQRLDDIQTRGSQQAFDRAVQQVGAERGADLAGAQFGLSRLGQLEGARQAQERLRQSGFDLGNRAALARAQQLASLGRGRQAETQARIAALQQQGAQQRALRQAALDMAYQDFLRQQDETRGQIGFYSSLLRGVPVTPNQTISTMQQQPGLFQSLVGTGLGALGLYRGMQ